MFRSFLFLANDMAIYFLTGQREILSWLFMYIFLATREKKKKLKQMIVYVCVCA